MINIDNVNVVGWESAIRGMRNPMNSWDKSDSTIEYCICGEEECTLGENDYKLMLNLALAGSDHSKYLRFLTVTFDMLSPLYFLKEFDTYKVGTVTNSCSTMHKLHSRELTRDDFSCEALTEFSLRALDTTINMINRCREIFIKTNTKSEWYQMVQLLPTSYNQLRTVQLNYQVLRSMYHSRKNHKLNEWRDFCKWVETLPYSELITATPDTVKLP